MKLSVVIILCALIVLILVLFPLVVSRKAEKEANKNEWEKIKDYGNRINKKFHKK
jgi:hypothetical protein|tara:strand:+ start:67 stop:231 length:165 start_codon:yes stop_codon:yes gene_type:complete